MNILRVKSLEIIHILRIRCGLRRSLPFLSFTTDFTSSSNRPIVITVMAKHA